MAMVQLGIPKQIIYLKNTNEKELLNTDIDDQIVMINPAIVSEQRRTQYWEACASCLDLMGRVERPYKINVRYQDPDFSVKEEVLAGFKATVFSHEYDHMFGILHIDIADVIYDMPVEERKEFRKQEENQYKGIAKISEYKYSLR